VFFAGGSGAQAASNSLDVMRFSGNDLQSNDVAAAAIENAGSGSGNAVRFPRRRAVR
jgi:hypothetical protein